jgi:hypothetical protein
MDGFLQFGSWCPALVHLGPAGRGHSALALLHRTSQHPLRTALALQPPGQTHGVQARRVRRRVPGSLRGPPSPRRHTKGDPEGANHHRRFAAPPPPSLNAEIHNPQNLAVAMSLARKLELRDQCPTAAAPTPTHPRHQQRGILPVPYCLALPSPPPAAPTGSTATIIEGCSVKRLS